MKLHHKIMLTAGVVIFVFVIVNEFFKLSYKRAYDFLMFLVCATAIWALFTIIEGIWKKLKE